MNHDTLLVIFVGLTAVALVAQAMVVVGGFFAIRKAIKKLHAEVTEVRGTVTPLLHKSREIVDKVSPRVDSISRDVADLVRRAREQGEDVQATTNDILGRVNRQTSRVDSMFTSAFDTVEHAGNVVADSVSGPVRQASAMLAAARAFVNVLTKGKQTEDDGRVAADQDMFV
jgi:uncharacterized protein YoxC